MIPSPPPAQWHLGPAHLNAVGAWQTTRGAHTTVALLDDGLDVQHPAFTGRVVAPFDALLGVADGAHKQPGECHGTLCAGIVGADHPLAQGVAPDTLLMPVRMYGELGASTEAEAIRYAADAGADVILCSWGPPSGPWQRPEHPLHAETFPLPAHTRDAVRYAVERGRDGLGCSIVWAIGSGRADMARDGYASNPLVMAVGGCNDRGMASVYNDHGPNLWCVAPSDDLWSLAHGHDHPLHPGLWTTDRRDGGRNGGAAGGFLHGPPGDDAGLFYKKFGGTSGAASCVAGLCALILSANPALTWQQVRTIVRQSCAPIDTERSFSSRTGWGRPDAALAVTLATRQP